MYLRVLREPHVAIKILWDVALDSPELPPADMPALLQTVVALGFSRTRRARRRRFLSGSPRRLRYW